MKDLDGAHDAHESSSSSDDGELVVIRPSDEHSTEMFSAMREQCFQKLEDAPAPIAGRAVRAEHVKAAIKRQFEVGTTRAKNPDVYLRKGLVFCRESDKFDKEMFVGMVDQTYGNLTDIPAIAAVYKPTLARDRRTQAGPRARLRRLFSYRRR
ncbi:hypothetical protein [Nocardioides sp. LML1-1-1.1]|uniref:hypothetical protein n=1 Tax=Nocardioides sp. LML1-1-1.1 TaxID=3135248 RepID=UPI00341606EF